MPSLDRELRKQLERTVRQARHIAEAGAEKAIKQLGAGDAEAPGHLKPEQKELRKRLRAHGRQLGDERNGRTGVQQIDHLVTECAYEHWHRMLFARFLAENDLLIEPESGMAISLQDALELAREKSTDWLALASDYAERMLPQIFRKDDPVLKIALPPEARSELEDLLKKLPHDVFVADDSLGWVYQFWQADKKDEVNESGNKIGADELAAVTQLFTEDYMVLFLLHNTLGAWWAGKLLAKSPKLAMTAGSEDELREACKVGDVVWTYLRFVRDKAEDGTQGPWRPAAGTFHGWPRAAKDVTVLDPCMGSGHFLVFALPILVACRMAEEGLSKSAAVSVVLKDNLFGLELDPRCTQIGAFNLALAAWRQVGHCALPAMNLACSGLAPNVRKEDWLSMAGQNERLRVGMEELYQLFQNAPILGSLINPRVGEDDLLVAAFHELQPLLERALAQEAKDEVAYEISVTARGLAKAAEILSGQFTLVTTNVPYLLRRKQHDELQKFCALNHSDANADLATSFVQRSISFCCPNGTIALVSPQNWLFLGTYKKLRQRLLNRSEWNVLVRIGENGFDSPQAAGAFTALIALTACAPINPRHLSCMNVADKSSPFDKATALPSVLVETFSQQSQLKNPDFRIGIASQSTHPLLEQRAQAYNGQRTGDALRFIQYFWEQPKIHLGWVHSGGAVDETKLFGGNEFILLWEDGRGQLAQFQADQAETAYASGGWKQGWQAWGKWAVRISQMRDLKASIHIGCHFDVNTAAIVPFEPADLLPIWCFCSSAQFNDEVRKIDQAVKVTNASLTKIPFDKSHWQKVAAETYPDGLPTPFSGDPTQGLFNGHPASSEQQAHVAVARLLGYQWPRQTGSSFPNCPALASDGLEELADDDGIVPISSVRGERPAAERFRELLARAFGKDWNANKQDQLLAQVGYADGTLEDWLRNGFFEQHSALFHNRPFIWHIWDGLRDGFQALVNYHRLATPGGEGRRTLERLIYAYLGDWITRQRADQAAEVDGADARVAHAEHLKAELVKILEGEPPYDIFVRWKTLHEQAIGWEPDVNDGVRLNIRPFMTARTLNARGAASCILRTTPKSIKWDKDRGKEPMREKTEYPWFWGWDGETEDFAGGREFDGNRWNDLHYSNAVKQAARDRRKPKAKGKK